MTAIPAPHHLALSRQPPETRATPLLHAAVGLAGTAWKSYWDWRARRATLRLLQSLDDRMLKDLGMTKDSLRSDR